MNKIQVVALDSFLHGEVRKANEEFETDSASAAELVRAGLVRLKGEPVAAKVEPEAESRRTRKRNRS